MHGPIFRKKGGEIQDEALYEAKKALEPKWHLNLSRFFENRFRESPIPSSEVEESLYYSVLVHFGRAVLEMSHGQFQRELNTPSRRSKMDNPVATGIPGHTHAFMSKDSAFSSQSSIRSQPAPERVIMLSRCGVKRFAPRYRSSTVPNSFAPTVEGDTRSVNSRRRWLISRLGDQ